MKIQNSKYYKLHLQGLKKNMANHFINENELHNFAAHLAYKSHKEDARHMFEHIKANCCFFNSLLLTPENFELFEERDDLLSDAVEAFNQAAQALATLLELEEDEA